MPLPRLRGHPAGDEHVLSHTRVVPGRLGHRSTGRPDVSTHASRAPRRSAAAATSSAAWPRPRSLAGRPPSMRVSSSSRSSPSTRRTAASTAVPVHHEVGVGERGHLGKVGDHQHLPPPGQRGQLLAHGQGGGPADAGIDLVERHHRGLPHPGGEVHRQHEPAQLPAAGDPRHRPGLQGGVGGEEELHLVEPAAGGSRRRHRDPEHRRAEPQLAQVALSGRGQAGPCGGASGGQGGATGSHLGLGRRGLLSQRVGPLEQPGEGLGAPGSLFPEGSHLCQRVAVLAAQVPQESQALFRGFQRRRGHPAPPRLRPAGRPRGRPPPRPEPPFAPPLPAGRGRSPPPAAAPPPLLRASRRSRRRRRGRRGGPQRGRYLLGVAEPLDVLPERPILVRSQAGRGYLPCLVAAEVQLSLQGPPVAPQGGQVGPQSLPALPGRPVGLQGRPAPGVEGGVDQRAHRRLAPQGDVLVLGHDLHHAAQPLLEDPEGHHGAVEVGPRVVPPRRDAPPRFPRRRRRSAPRRGSPSRRDRCDRCGRHHPGAAAAPRAGASCRRPSPR